MVNVSNFFLKLIAGITNLVSARFRPEIECAKMQSDENECTK